MAHHVAQMADVSKRAKARAAFARAASSTQNLNKQASASLKAREKAFGDRGRELAAQFYDPNVVYTFDYFDSFFRADCFHLDLKVGVARFFFEVFFEHN
jgi:hypothetical protein